MEEESLSPEIETRLLASLHSTRLISGFTHNFYRYPARMSPDFAREVIAHFSRPGEMVLDPFMGGGTTLIEALAHGRRSIGVDLNPLAAFVTTAKTTPLSSHDAVTMVRWSEDVPASGSLLRYPRSGYRLIHEPRTYPRSCVPLPRLPTPSERASLSTPTPICPLRIASPGSVGGRLQDRRARVGLDAGRAVQDYPRHVEGPRPSRSVSWRSRRGEASHDGKSVHPASIIHRS